MHVTALGKAMLAEFPESRVREIIDQNGLNRVTGESIADEDELFDELESIREHGYSFQENEHEIGIAAYGAPIKSNDGSTIGSVAVAGPTTRLSDSEIRENITESLSRAVNVIEIEYDHRLS